ncbi:S53 family peptidase [Streptomyces violaceorubidus]
MRSRPATRRIWAGGLATLPLLAGALTLTTPLAHASEAPARHDLPGAKPRWATAQADRGTASGAEKVSVRVYLAGRDAAGLAAYARAVSDPRSPSYGQYLSPRQAQARFGTTAAQIATVRSWLTSAGLKVTGGNRHYVFATGDAASAEAAFGTRLHEYAKDGKTYRAPAGTVSVPSYAAGAVLGVSGLDNAPRLLGHDDQLPQPKPAVVNSGPFSTYYGSALATSLPSAYGHKVPYAVKGYTGRQLRAAYGAKHHTGKGVRVAVVDAYTSPTLLRDTAAYAERHGDGAWRKGQLKQVLPERWTDTEECDAAGWYGEQTLDVEAVHAVAPAADITYVGAASCSTEDFYDALAKVVDGHLADMVSNSWGDFESNVTPDVAAAYDQVFQMGAVQGTGFYFSSGDYGDTEIVTGTKQVEFPADSAWVTAVGGTSLAVGKRERYLWETGWGTERAVLSPDGTAWDGFPGTFNGAAGGGTSRTVPQPSYQRGVVPAALATAHGTPSNRVVPDLSAVADPNTGFLVGQTQTFPDGSRHYNESRVGGTSLAAPVITALQALAQEARGGSAIGFANPVIYSTYGSRVYHDVTDTPTGVELAVARRDFVNGHDESDGLVTSVRSLGKNTSLRAVRGYDPVTGVGSPAPGYVESYRRH